MLLMYVVRYESRYFYKYDCTILDSMQNIIKNSCSSVFPNSFAHRAPYVCILCTFLPVFEIEFSVNLFLPSSATATAAHPSAVAIKYLEKKITR